jgi:hypothetical protein
LVGPTSLYVRCVPLPVLGAEQEQPSRYQKAEADTCLRTRTRLATTPIQSPLWSLACLLNDPIWRRERAGRERRTESVPRRPSVTARVGRTPMIRAITNACLRLGCGRVCARPPQPWILSPAGFKPAARNRGRARGGIIRSPGTARSVRHGHTGHGALTLRPPRDPGHPIRRRRPRCGSPGKLNRPGLWRR